MAIIPNDEQFIGLSATVDTTERRSALVNAESQAYTMQDIVDTVEDALPPAVNPTSGYYPINRDDAFVNSGLHNIVEALPPFLPPTEGSLGLAFDDPFAGTRLLALDPLNFAYTFGNASYDAPTNQAYASGGLSVLEAGGEAVIGCGISSGANGVFRASGAQGFVTIGTTPSRSIGVISAGGPPAVFLGSTLTGGSPTDSVTPVAWTKVRNESGTIYYSPLYQ